METETKVETINSKEEKNESKPDELIAFYHFKCCSCIIIFVTIMYLIFIWFPVLFFIFYCRFPYKRVVIVDKNKNILILCSKGMIPCCKLDPKIFFLNSIKKVIVYITWINDPKIGFNKLYYINCDLISNEGLRENIIFGVQYNENKVNEYLTFFRKYFDTEFIPADNQNPNFPNEENSQAKFAPNQDDIDTISKPSINEDAAMPINA